MQETLQHAVWLISTVLEKQLSSYIIKCNGLHVNSLLLLA